MSHDTYPLTILHDGQCPICELDMNNLKARNHDGRLRFIDISAADFDPVTVGRTAAVLRAEIHAMRADGQLVSGMEVFRLAYRAVGLGWVTAASGWPVLRPFADLAYRAFAVLRPALSARFRPLFEHLLARQALRRSRACHNGTCRLS